MQNRNHAGRFVYLVDNPIHIGLSPMQKVTKADVLRDDGASRRLLIKAPNQPFQLLEPSVCLT